MTLNIAPQTESSLRSYHLAHPLIQGGVDSYLTEESDAGSGLAIDLGYSNFRTDRESLLRQMTMQTVQGVTIQGVSVC